MTYSEANPASADFEPYSMGMTMAEKQYPLPPAKVDVEIYRDEGRYHRELENVLLEAWFPVHPSSDVAAPKDYIVWEQMGQSVVITRRADGTVAAWHNVCQHRGARLVNGSGNCKIGKFKCPWHGFVYNLDGEVTSVPLRESFDECDLEGLRAPAVRAEEWGGWIWLSFSERIPALREYLGTIGDELEGYDLEEFTTVYRTSVTLKANWKIVVDAFNETWHVPFTHKDTLAGTVMWRDAILKITEPHTWMTIPIRGFTDKAAEGADHRTSHLCHYLVFPNTIFSCFPTHLQMWSAWPVSVDETVLCAYQIVGPTPPGRTDEKWAKANKRDWEAFLEVVGEDSEVINDFARVIGSRGFTRNLFNTAESRLTSFHEQVEKRL
ncbi:aromatic ring-hydroxylating dioxygenase subunit alpha [Nocardia sp. NPDC004860]|uniref:aromatic ring-hydroxylating oxygenase subunit alpha n=1 Tax=Nocardia sp. NPDC004860 TaxID=3154557 RepID=UPI0033BB7457